MGNENWIPARAGWAQFCRENPGMGLKGSDSSFVWFCRTHAPALISAGVMRRTNSRRLLVNVETFGPAAFAYFTTGAGQ